MKTLNSSLVVSLVFAAAVYACSGHEGRNEPGGAGTAGISHAGTAGDRSESGGARSSAGAGTGASAAGSDSVAGGDSEAGATGTGGDRGAIGAGGESGTSGASGTSGTSGTSGADETSQTSLLGVRVRFMGAPQVHGTSSEAELMALVTSETGLSPVRIQGNTSAPTLAATDLVGTDVLVIESLLRDYSEPETQVVADWVAGGHGLIVLNGFTSDGARAQSFVKSYAVTFGALIQPTTAAYVSTFAVHPLTAAVSSLYFFGGFPMTTSDPTAVQFASIGLTAVGLALTHGNGRVAVWGDDWIVLSEELTRVDGSGAQPTATFWKNALRWAVKRDPNATVSAFCENWAKAACSDNVVLACSGATKVDASLTDHCVISQRALCEALLPAKGYSSRFASQCVNAVKTAYSDARLTAQEIATVRHRGDPCNHLVKGAQGAGEACVSDDDCDTLKNYQCISKSGAGSCQLPTVVDNGDSCAAPGSVCHVGYYCGADETCVPSKAVGKTCVADFECASGLVCDPNSATCTARVSADRCAIDDDCTTHVCDIPVGSSQGRCVASITLAASAGICQDLR